MIYNEDMLDEMESEIDLLDYAENTMEFVRRGKRYFTNCPLHIDNTPSLCITPEVNKWYCHSCHEGGNIYTWIQTFENMSFPQAVEKVSELTNHSIEEYIESETVGVYKEINRCETKKTSDIKREILDINKDYFDKYSDELPQEWIDEGIKPEVMRLYDIRTDRRSQRIVYPVLDQDGNFISVKGRTRFDNYKTLGLAKYINFYPIGSIDYLQGFKQAEEEIKNSKSVIIFEGVKSCMKSYGWGIKNTAASENCELSDGQLEFLIKSNLREVIIGWDNDKLFKDIVANEKIQMLKKFTKVSVIRDKDKLLGKKMAPVDAGEEIYRKLLKERVVI